MAIGLPYLRRRAASDSTADVRSVTFEYGNTFLHGGGRPLNILVILDAYDTALGRQALTLPPAAGHAT